MKKNMHITGMELTFSAQDNILSTTDLDGQITYINKNFITISGFTSDGLIGQNHHIVRHPDMPAEVFRTFWTDLRANKSWMGIVKKRCKNSDHYWVDSYATPIKKNGKTEEYQSVERKTKAEYITIAEAVYTALTSEKSLENINDSISQPSKLILSILVCLLLPLITYFITDSKLWMFVFTVLASLFSCGTAFLFTRPIIEVLKRRNTTNEERIARYICSGRNDKAVSLSLPIKKLGSENAAPIGRINDMSSTLSENAQSLSVAVVQSENGTLRQFEQTEHVASAVDENASTIMELKQPISNDSKTIDNVANSSNEVEKFLDVIMTLANSTQSATKEIREVFGQLQSDVKAAVAAMRTGETIAGLSVTKHHDTTKTLGSILVAIKTISGKSELITSAVREQNAVTESVLDIKSNAQENLEAVKLSGTVATKTVNITKRLDQLTNQFWETQQGF